MDSTLPTAVIYPSPFPPLPSFPPPPPQLKATMSELADTKKQSGHELIRLKVRMGESKAVLRNH